jgi:pyrimidine-nucleoside phosphorylase
MVKEIVDKGSAIRKFQEVVAAQGGDPLALQEHTRMPTARRTETITSPVRGFVQGLDAGEVGVAAMLLGAGRASVDATIDHGAGVILHRKIGDKVEAGDPLATLYFNDAAGSKEARERVGAAFCTGEQPPAKTNLIHQVIT